ncbi:MAG TPA: tetratricopeptide repeat protein [Blastocatellia bacterium]|nr:tetratricopeptide repeat protein [Blastocatellia bacterium]
MKRAVIIILVILGCSVRTSAAQDTSADAVAGARSLIDKGEYATAEKKAKELLTARPQDAAARIVLADVMFETGRYPDAATEYERAAKDAKGAVWLRAMLGRVRALAAQGKDEEARQLAQEFIRYYNSNSPRSAEELTLIAQAMVYLEKYKDANELLIDAREADPSFAEAFIAQGELLLEKYNYGDAASLFSDALKIDEKSVRAQIGLARSKQLSSSAEPPMIVDRALAINPNYTDALALRAWLELEADRFDSASKAIDRALAVNPNYVPAIALRAAIFYLADKKPEMEAEIKRALAINPHAGEFFATLAHFATNNRRYADAVEFGRRAVELSPRLWSARTELGIQLLRVGRMTEGREELERAFAGDPYNVWAKNTLDLLDSMKDFAESVRGPFIIKSSQKESAALTAYAADLLEEAYKKLTAKYKFTPRAPLSVEIFDSHADFAVRSLGLPGLGALGVCFGQVIAMDSPSARASGEFNWGSTLWHEFTHVITLQMTDHRIPRWFSEGLSVYEERRARKGWGDNWSLERLKAFASGQFVKIDDLDAAFTRPKTPDGVILAYFQASMVCEFVEEKFGFDAILKMLALFKEGAKTTDVLKRALNLSPADFDRAFNEYIRAKTAPYIEAVSGGAHQMPGAQSLPKEALIAMLKEKPNDFFAHLRLGAIYKSDGDAAQAIEHLKRATELFPFYAGPNNPYILLADIYESRGQKAEAAAALESLVEHNETNAEAIAKLARLKLSTKDAVGALDSLRQSFYIQPFDASLHKLAGDVYLEQGSAAEAVREFTVRLSLAPPDMAEAHFDLARALEAQGNHAEARREVLRSLEIAPGFEKAQELLLKLRGGS